MLISGQIHSTTQPGGGRVEFDGSDQARLRVLASDGFNTVVAPSALFEVERKGPQWVTIVAPEEGGVFPIYALPRLQGGAWDAEDGVLEGASLVWSSSIDGELGTGDDLYAELSPGLHTITLTATDSDGASGSTSVSIQVGTMVYLPMVVRGYGP